MATVAVHNQTSGPLTMNDGRTVAAFGGLTGVNSLLQPQASYLASGKLVVTEIVDPPDPDAPSFYDGTLKGTLQGPHGSFPAGRLNIDTRDADENDPLLWNGSTGFVAKKLPSGSLEDSVVSGPGLADPVDGQVPVFESGEWTLGEGGGGGSDPVGSATNPVTDAAAERPTGLTQVWWQTATLPTNIADGDRWVQV